ncbi:HEPN domain-containing protein [Kosakonia oryzae]|uniref:RiboL-PSP-HEPN domain-containing protein n=1 Tax=Kosakonia oryzae TaxID=497725 RepID=A0AA94H783_9ENTR|nr:HEPN domain-containing protein [Kosakonia oryzae]ANI80670.1 hypothetical protein AWR26_00375 [Kosakonia oryzae]SFD17360.1 hypothetical protein SAMN05216286_4543 [Kosakonia oryzae]
MMNSCLVEYFRKIDILFLELDKLAPENDVKNRSIRNEFAGLMVISLAANYENCVKTILINYADLFHDKFSHQVERKYSYLNSRIKYETLKEYLSHFDGDLFNFENKVSKYSIKLKNEINKTYDQILTWRHSYAHANSVITSLTDAYKAHRYAKYILYSFEDSLLGHAKRDSVRLINIFNRNSSFAFDAIESNYEKIKDRINNETNLIAQKDEANYLLATARKFKTICEEAQQKANECSINILPSILNQAQNAATECQKASKAFSALKNGLCQAAT